MYLLKPEIKSLLLIYVTDVDHVTFIQNLPAIIFDHLQDTEYMALKVTI